MKKSLAVFVILAMYSSVVHAAVITLSGGDAGEGLTLYPSLVVVAERNRGTSIVIQGTTFVTANTVNAISFAAPGLSNSTGGYPTPGSPTTNDTNITTLLNTAVVSNTGNLTTTITGLTIGKPYVVNLLMTEDSSNNFNRELQFTFNNVVGGGSPINAFRTAIQTGYNVQETIIPTATTITIVENSPGYYTPPSSNTLVSGAGTNFSILSGAAISQVPATIGLSSAVNATVIRGGNANVGTSIANSAISGAVNLNYSLAATGGGSLTITGTPDTGSLVAQAAASAQTANVVTNAVTTPIGVNAVAFTATATDSNATNSGTSLNADLTVLDHSNGIFNNVTGAATGSLSNSNHTLDLNFGTVALNAGGGFIDSFFDIFADVTTASFTARLDLDSISAGTGSVSQLFRQAGATTASNIVASNTLSGYTYRFDTTAIGTYSAQYIFTLSDENLSGATSQTITLNLQGTVAAVPEPNALIMSLCGGVGVWFMRRPRRRS
jgi:hypothetical protein